MLMGFCWLWVGNGFRIIIGMFEDWEKKREDLRLTTDNEVRPDLL